jgi:hypothetical protein
MTQGYLLFAINMDQDGAREYSKLAYACALSIKGTQPAGFNSVSVVTNDPAAFAGYQPVFDHIIDYTGPLGMAARSRAYDFTPYSETVFLDADMLFLRPMDHYWDIMGQQDLFITTAPQTHRGRRFRYGYYREIMQKNQWVDVYSAWTYFKKPNALAGEFFELVKTMTDDPQPFINLFMNGSLYKSIPTDEAFALSLRILDIEDQVCPDWDFPRITHMKPAVQGWRESIADWTDKLQFSMHSHDKIKLGVWQQSELLHYVKKELITDAVIQQLEQAL